MKSFFALTFATLATLAAACAQPAHTTPAPSPVTPAAPASSAPFNGKTATATLHDLAGRNVGSVTLTDSYAGLLLSGDVNGIGLGGHAIHIHAIGKCEVPFTSAGGHFNPTQHQHGFKNPAGPHLGDLPNIDTPPAGKLHFEILAPGITLTGTNALLDADGASIVIHASHDDYVSDPAGNAGGRIACGVIREK